MKRAQPKRGVRTVVLVILDAALLAVVAYHFYTFVAQRDYQYYTSAPQRLVLPIAIGCGCGLAVYVFFRLPGPVKRKVAVCGLAVLSGGITWAAGWWLYALVRMIRMEREPAGVVLLPVAIKCSFAAGLIAFLALAIGGWWLLARLLRSSWGLERRRGQGTSDG